MINKNFIKFSLGFLAVIAVSFGALVAIGYYKIDDSTLGTASNGKEFEMENR